MNKAMLIGRLGQDPEVKYTQMGTAVSNFSIATSNRWRDKNGDQQEKTEWHRIVAWGRLGEICGEYLQKGKQVFVCGRIETNKWQDRDGTDRYTTQIVATEVEFLGSRNDNGGQNIRPPSTPPTRGEMPPGASDDDDSIPF